MTLADEAQRLLQQGRVVDAERLFERVLDESPNHIEALNVVALSALRAGHLQRAITLLGRAAAANPDHAITLHHLGIARASEGDFAAAAAAQSSAVKLNPEFHLARLYLAEALEKIGEQDRAVVQYARSLQDAQQSGRWLNAETTPPRLQLNIEHAVMTVRDHRRAALSQLLEPLIEKYGRESMRRVERCLRVYWKEENFVSPDLRQQPKMFFFPDLPPAPYLDRSLFSWIPAFESATPAIQRELQSLLPRADGRERVFRTDVLEELNLRGDDLRPSWNGYYFYRYGSRRDDNHEKCPDTSRTLGLAPLCRIPGNAPEVLYSVFTAGTHLLPHRGVTNTRLVAHLPLLVPDNCALRVGGELHVWEEGRVVIFDDTYEHEAWNRSNRTRVVLIFDIWNPYLTEPECAAVTDIIRAISETQKAVNAA